MIWPTSIRRGPGASLTLAGQHGGADLVRTCCERLPPSVERVVLHLGCDTDLRLIIGGIPDRWPFLRVCWLRFARPSYKGRLLNGSEVAYVFGAPPPPRDGHVLMPGESPTEGEATNTDGLPRTPGHPCPRRLQHVRWLLRWFCARGVIDPFAGSGTVAVGARHLQRDYLGIEIEAEYVALARRRLADDAPLLTPLLTREVTP